MFSSAPCQVSVARRQQARASLRPCRTGLRKVERICSRLNRGRTRGLTMAQIAAPNPAARGATGSPHRIFNTIRFSAMNIFMLVGARGHGDRRPVDLGRLRALLHPHELCRRARRRRRQRRGPAARLVHADDGLHHAADHHHLHAGDGRRCSSPTASPGSTRRSALIGFDMDHSRAPLEPLRLRRRDRQPRDVSTASPASTSLTSWCTAPTARSPRSGGRWLLAFTWDTGFSIEHVYGHHRYVGTEHGSGDAAARRVHHDLPAPLDQGPVDQRLQARERAAEAQGHQGPDLEQPVLARPDDDGRRRHLLRAAARADRPADLAVRRLCREDLSRGGELHRALRARARPRHPVEARHTGTATGV